MVTKRKKEMLREFEEFKKKRAFGEEIKKLGKDVTPIVPQQPIQRPPRGTGITNFFAHKSDREVFGDDGLTFFDSQKTSRGKSSTAELFGIG